MRRSMQVLLGLGLGVAVAGGGVGLIEATSSSSKAAPAAAAKAVAPAAGSATVNVTTATVGGRSEQILVNARGLPLYTYGPDSPTQSHVSGGLAALWPPLVAASPSEAGATGKLSVIADRLGQQVLYNGHFLYTFVDDTPGQVTGQGVQDFFVATPGPGAASAGAGADRASCASQWQQQLQLQKLRLLIPIQASNRPTAPGRLDGNYLGAEVSPPPRDLTRPAAFGPSK